MYSNRYMHIIENNKGENINKNNYINTTTGKGKMFFPGEQLIGYILKPVKK